MYYWYYSIMKIALQIFLALLIFSSCQNQSDLGLWLSENENFDITVFNISEKRMTALEISQMYRAPESTLKLNRINNNHFSNDSIDAIFDLNSLTIQYYRDDSLLSVENVIKLPEFDQNISGQEFLKNLSNKHIEFYIDDTLSFSSNIFDDGLALSLSDTSKISVVDIKVFNLDNQLFLMYHDGFKHLFHLKSLDSNSIECTAIYNQQAIFDNSKITISDNSTFNEDLLGEWVLENESKNDNLSFVVEKTRLLFSDNGKLDTVNIKHLYDNNHIVTMPYSSGYKSKIFKYEINKVGKLEITDYRGRHKNITFTCRKNDAQ